MWGTPRIQSELALLGHVVAESTIDEYKVRPRKPPSQTWRTFLDNHVKDIVAIDFFTVPTATFRLLFAFVVLHHNRRHVVHFNVTAHPTAEWAAHQIVEAFPEETMPRFLIRDRDSIYGTFFQERVKHMGIEQALTAYCLHGSHRTSSESSDRSVASALITVSFSMNATSDGSSRTTSTTTITLARICRSITTRLLLEILSHRIVVG